MPNPVSNEEPIGNQTYVFCSFRLTTDPMVCATMGPVPWHPHSANRSASHSLTRRRRIYASVDSQYSETPRRGPYWAHKPEAPHPLMLVSSLGEPFTQTADNTPASLGRRRIPRRGLVGLALDGSLLV